MVNIIEAIQDSNLLGGVFKKLDTWCSWIVALKAIFALPLSEEDLILYQKCTGRQIVPQKPFKEVYFVVGRRGGKSFICAIIAVFLAIFKDFSPYLAPGERGTIMIVAVDRKQAGIILRYIRAMLFFPLFRKYIENVKQEEIELTNKINISVHTCSFRAVRGYTIVAAILEESAFWRVEGANPDHEIYTALKPAMMTIPESLLLSISTPYSKQGLLWENYREFFGTEDEEVLVWQASSLLMNPSLSTKMIEKQRAKDPQAAKAEWDGEFREDLEQFLSLEIVERCVIPGRVELPYLDKFSYSGFCDPSGGGADNFTLSIGHQEDEKMIQDLLRATKGDPYQIVKEYAGILKKYHINEVSGDRYAAAWVSEAFQRAGINYQPSEFNKSEIYLEALPFLNAGMTELLDSRELVKELIQLERRRGSSGKDIIDHPKSIGGGVPHDDRANATCGMVVLCQGGGAGPGLFFAGGRG
ncbi:MAG: hypothetical protein NT096_01625 [Proteobacteria bacterium]|nr:hypothetical protein [Pseudomonadota bacterium]